MSQNLNIILTRHSQTIHNKLKSQIQSLSSVKQKYKKSPEYLAFKFNEDFVDRQEINLEEIETVKNKDHLQQIGLIIVSPLSRCILTAKEFNVNGAPIIVDMLIASRIGSAWSTGKSLKTKKQKFTDVNFQYCQQEKIHWCVDLLIEDESDFKEFYHLRKDQFQRPETLILEYLKLGKGETYTSIIKRALAFKQKLLNVYMKMTDKKILIVSHSNCLKVLTANRICQKGKARSDFLFDHMDFIYITKDSLIRSDILKMEKTSQTKKKNKKEVQNSENQLSIKITQLTLTKQQPSSLACV